MNWVNSHVLGFLNPEFEDNTVLQNNGNHLLHKTSEDLDGSPKTVSYMEETEYSWYTEEG